MRAARFHGREDVRIEDVPEPDVRPGTVKVRVEWCGICGTDLHEYLDGPIFCPTPEEPHALTGEAAPVVLGHEFAGVVADVGDGVDGFEAGDRVVVEPYLTCGTCPRCRAGDYNICDTLGFIGLSGGGGGFSEYVVADAKRTFGLGELGTDVGALVEPLAVAYHAVRLGSLEEGMTATVFGSGPIGLMTTATLRALGASEVVVVEPADVRKKMAANAGATHVLDPTEVDVTATIKELTDGVGTDLAFECAGVDAALNAAVTSVRGRGRVVNVAIWGHEPTVAMNNLVFNEVEVVASLAYRDDHPATIDLLREGGIEPQQFITGRIDLDDIVHAGFRELIDNKAENVKILVQP